MLSIDAVYKFVLFFKNYEYGIGNSCTNGKSENQSSIR